MPPIRLHFVLYCAAFVTLSVLTGCSANFNAVSSGSIQQNTGSLKGMLHGGQSPVVGARVYLYAASTAGYGAASVSLLTAATGNPADANSNYYGVTDANGEFNITGDYTCTTGQQLYLYAVGGDSSGNGSGANPDIGEMAVLGECSTVASLPYIYMNEVSTVAAAYALAPFAQDAKDVGILGQGPVVNSVPTLTPLEQTDLSNAFANAAKLYDITGASTVGQIANTSVPGNTTATVPQATIDTLANILATCINAAASDFSMACETLVQYAVATGFHAGEPPPDTATAAINIAQSPGSNVGVLYQSASNVFRPALTGNTPPNDFSIGINYTGGGIDAPTDIAIDGSGNVWVANYSGNSVTELTSSGMFSSGTAGYSGFSQPHSIAIDNSNHAWVTNNNGGAGGGFVREIASGGSTLSYFNSFAGGSFFDPNGIAIDGQQNIWVADGGNSVIKVSTYEGYPSSGSVYSGGSLGHPTGIAMDALGDAWVTNNGGTYVAVLSNTGTNIIDSGSAVYNNFSFNKIAVDSVGRAWVPSYASQLVNTFVDFSGAYIFAQSTGNSTNLVGPASVAIDGAGNAWVADTGSSTFAVSEFSDAGFNSLISTLDGHPSWDPPFSGDPPFSVSVAVDGSGDVWMGSYTTTTSSVTELVGAATPVITPICAGLPATPGTFNNLGTRP